MPAPRGRCSVCECLVPMRGDVVVEHDADYNVSDEHREWGIGVGVFERSLCAGSAEPPKEAPDER